MSFLKPICFGIISLFVVSSVHAWRLNENQNYVNWGFCGDQRVTATVFYARTSQYPGVTPGWYLATANRYSPLYDGHRDGITEADLYQAAGEKFMALCNEGLIGQ